MSVEEFYELVRSELYAAIVRLEMQAKAENRDYARKSTLVDQAAGVHTARRMVEDLYRACRPVQHEDVPADPGAAVGPGEPARPGP